MKNLILIFGLFLVKSEAVCNNTREEIWTLLGHQLEKGETMTITVCNSTNVQENKPINLGDYKNYLQIKGEYWREINFEKLQILYDDTFSLLSEIKYLKIMQTDLEEIQPRAFNGILNLLELNLNRNKLKTLPKEVFNNLAKLRVLDLSDNYLESLDEHIFDKLTELEYLNLGINKLKEVSPYWFAKTIKLQNLRLNTNKYLVLKSETFKNLSQLEELHLVVSGIEVIEKDAFKGLESLKKINLMYNAFYNRTISIDFPNELNHMKNLKEFYLSRDDFYCDDLNQAIEIFKQRNITNNAYFTDTNCHERTK